MKISSEVTWINAASTGFRNQTPPVRPLQAGFGVERHTMRGVTAEPAISGTSVYFDLDPLQPGNHKA